MNARISAVVGKRVSGSAYTPPRLPDRINKVMPYE
jgi:hypothetical protein